MKVSFAFLLPFVSLLLPTLSFACKCIVPTVPSALTDSDAVFRGKVIRELKATKVGEPTKAYVIQARRIYKGCAFEQGNRVVVTTSSSSASCGVTLEVNGTYVFSSATSTPIDAATKKKLGKKSTKITRAVSIVSCGYNRKWDEVPAADLTLLRNYDNDVCVPESCTAGADCLDSTKYYCDTGKCTAYDAPCPDGTTTVNCLADPCQVAKPCTTMDKCLSNYCGGCNAIFIDTTGTRVCVD